MKQFLLKPWLITLIICLLYTLWILSLGHGDPLTFTEIGTRFSQNNPNGSEGYDGQFFYFIAVDPDTAPAKIDVPAYRFQRILYPMLARWLALGQEAFIPWLLVIINLVAIPTGVWLTEKLLTRQRVNRWHALPVGLYGGQLLSLRVDLPEPLALALMLAGMWLFESANPLSPASKNKPPATLNDFSRQSALNHQRLFWLSALCFTLAVFVKETMLISGLGYALFLLGCKQIKKGLALMGLLIIPFALYQFYLYVWLGSFGLGSGGAGATPFEVIPLAGLFKVALVSGRAFGLFLLILGPIVILPSLWGVVVSGKDILSGRRWHPWGLTLGFNALIILFLPFSTFREPLAMLRLSLPLVALVILYSGLTKRWRVLNYSYLWIVTLIFMFQEPLW